MQVVKSLHLEPSDFSNGSSVFSTSAHSKAVCLGPREESPSEVSKMRTILSGAIRILLKAS